MSVIRRLHVPVRKPEDVIPHLGAAHHWKDGRSAKSLADLWWAANGLPLSIRAMLDLAPEWRSAELIDGFMERCTNLNDGRPSHSQSDLLAVLSLDQGIGILVIEAKVDEGFDRTVTEWLAVPSDGKQARLRGLCHLLGLTIDAVGDLRYQLLHRTAAAILEARRYRTSQAAMIVQSWSATDDGFEDFKRFVATLGLSPPRRNSISDVVTVSGVDLRLGWSSEKAKG